jgi:hypothetical protein
MKPQYSNQPNPEPQLPDGTPQERGRQRCKLAIGRKGAPPLVIDPAENSREAIDKNGSTSSTP